MGIVPSIVHSQSHACCTKQVKHCSDVQVRDKKCLLTAYLHTIEILGATLWLTLFL